MRLVKPKKFLGQHFLKDLKVDACPGLPILEVGPGMGVLTQFLLPKERELKVVEVDYESVAYLREAYPQLEEHIIEDDFLKMNLTRLFGGRPFVLTGNYPYNISSQIFFKMLDNKDLIPCCTGMIQKEVAERMAAGPGSKTYGILSVLVPLHRPRKRVQPAAQGEERRHPHDAQRHARPGVRRTPVQTGGEDDLQPATQDAAQLHQTPRGQGLPPDASRPLRPAARTAVRTGVRGADEPSERILK